MTWLVAVACTKDDEVDKTVSNTPTSAADASSLYFPPSGNTTWATTDPATLGWETAKIPALYNLLSTNGTRAFIVLKDGKIVMEAYFGKTITGLANFTKDSYWYWASAGKTLTSFTVGKAQEDGFLKIGDKTSTYLGKGWTSLTTAQEDLITVRNQLTMTTGLDDGVANSDNTTPASLIYKAPAGSRWAYHNAPYTLLEKVVANATKKTFDTYFNSVLKNKIGMDGYWLKTGDNNVYYSSARSMAKFGLLMLNKGVWNSQVIMKDAAYFNQMITPSQTLNKSYGYLWWLNGKESYMMPKTQFIFPGSIIPQAPADMYSALGKDGQYLNVIPSKGIVVVRMGENPEATLVPVYFLRDIWTQLSDIMNL